MDDPFTAVAREELISPTDLTQYGQVGWIYRAHAKACWSLETSLERCCNRHDVAVRDRPLVEQELFREFRRAYHEYSVYIPDQPAIVEWLALMQHYGAPTRLLDFTYSIHIAAYFAVEKTTTDSAIWAINAEWAMGQSVERLKAVGKSPEHLDRLKSPFMEGTEAIVHHLLFESPFALITCPLNPFRLNERLRIQKGVFLTPGSIEAPFMENLSSMPGYDKRENLFRVLILAQLAEKVRAALFDMNITRRSLFPGLDGYAQALGVYHPVFNPEEPHRKRLETLRG